MDLWGDIMNNTYRLLVLVTGLGVSLSGIAQDLVLEEITVTARKKAETLQDVPISVSVTTGAEIQEQGLRDLQAIATTVPAVNVSKAGAGAFINVRGIGSGENPGFEQSVGYAVDGMALARSRATRAGVFDLERVEILKGPQTTYFGANTIAGVINVTTKKASLEDGLAGYIGASHESETEEQVIEGAINLPVAETFALRLAGKFTDSDGYLTNEALNTKEPALEDILFRAGALWAPTDNFEATLKVTSVETEANSALDMEIRNCTPLTLPPTLPPPVGFPQFNCINADGNPVNDELDFRKSTDLPGQFRKLDLDVLMLALDWQVSEYTLTSVTGGYEFDNEFLFDLDLTAVPSLFSPSRFNINQLDGAEHVSQEFRVSSPTDGGFSWEAGIYYQDEEAFFSNVTTADFSPLGPPGVPPAAPTAQAGARTTQSSETMSVFATASYDFTDRLTATFGIRYIEVDKEIEQSPVLAGPIPADNIPNASALAPFGGFVFETESRSDDDVLPSVDFVFAWTESTNLFGSFRQGFKAGGYSMANPPMGVMTDFIQGFEPETMDAFEIGIKGTYLDGRLGLNLTLFHMEFDDRQVSSLAEAGTSLTQAVANAATSTSQGLEMDFTALISDNVALKGAFTLLDSSYDEFPNAPCYTGQTPAEGCNEILDDMGMGTGAFAQDLSGVETTYAPEYAGTLTAIFDVPIGDYTVSIEPNVQFTDGYVMISDFNPLNVQDSWTKWNLRVALTPESDRWQLAFVGRNLNDEATTHFCQEVPAAFADTVACSVDAPATYMIQGKFNF